METYLGLIINYIIIFTLLFLLSKDAKRHDIYLSRTLKVLFLLTFTAPFIIIWYLVIRKNKKKEFFTEETYKVQ